MYSFFSYAENFENFESITSDTVIFKASYLNSLVVELNTLVFVILVLCEIPVPVNLDFISSIRSTYFFSFFISLKEFSLGID